MLCHFVCTHCKYIALLYYLLKFYYIEDYTYDKLMCVEHSMDFKLRCFDCKSSLVITKRFIAVTHVPAYNYMFVCMY